MRGGDRRFHRISLERCSRSEFSKADSGVLDVSLQGMTLH